MAINWTTVNIPTIITVAATAVGMVTYFNGLDSRLTKIEETSVVSQDAITQNFEEVNNKIEQQAQALENIPYRVGVIERGLEEANRRVDRLSDAILNSMDGLRKDVNSLGTKVEVMSSKLDDFAPQRKAAVERLDIPQRN
jgi:uncharacterized protein YkvS